MKFAMTLAAIVAFALSSTAGLADDDTKADDSAVTPQTESSETSASGTMDHSKESNKGSAADEPGSKTDSSDDDEK